jgi:geranylgeranyl diphosphate synthase type I
MIADTLGYFESRRGEIARAIGSLVPDSGPSRESMERIAEFCGRGKMIRGCLVFLGAEIAGAGNGADLPLVAAAMELFQAGLLAHDDIMDRDELRRGSPTIHARYAAEAEARAEAFGRVGGFPPGEARHLGEALAICLGDLCYFAAFETLSRALAGNSSLGEIVGLCGSVLGEVAVAQMTDVAWGAGSDEVPEEKILEMYRGKTAHYSFSLPLAVGALAAVGGPAGGTENSADRGAAPGAAARESLVRRLYEFGERLGLLFQIRDDELGLFGSAESIGKVAGSDLREGKKTLFRSRLLSAAPVSEQERLRAFFGGGLEAKSEDIAYIKRLSEELGVARSIADMSRKAEDEARTIIDALPSIERSARSVLEGLVDYVTRREK